MINESVFAKWTSTVDATKVNRKMSHFLIIFSCICIEKLTENDVPNNKNRSLTKGTETYSYKSLMSPVNREERFTGD